MRVLLILSSILLSLNSIFAQLEPEPSPPLPQPPVEEIFAIVEDMPYFPGCDDIADKTQQLKCSDEKLVTFLGQNVQPSMSTHLFY